MLGYFLEIGAAKAEPLLRPPLSGLFIHRQTMANQVRFTTVELADLDARIARAADRALAMELEIFEAWRERGAQALAPPIQAAAEALARLDVAAALARVGRGGRRGAARASTARWPSRRRPRATRWSRRRCGAPAIPSRPTTAALDARRRGRRRGSSIVTGPNMAGKSTFLRQNALLAILAQAGSFVPAKSLRLGVVDRLFSRVGAGDDLARGRSTFMAEMVETAAILTQATPRSFVILDEIGRGTATYDGLAIAWACAEALHDVNRCRALFATHYHELARPGGAPGARLQPVAEGQGVERRPGVPARGGAGRRPTAPTACRWPSSPACRRAVVARARQVLDRLESEAVAHAGPGRAAAVRRLRARRAAPPAAPARSKPLWPPSISTA